MTREIGITKTFRIVMTWTVMQQAMQKRKALGGGAQIWLSAGGRGARICLRTRSSHTSAAKPADLSPALGACQSARRQSLPSRTLSAVAARGITGRRGGRQLGCLEVMLTRVSHFNSNLKFISNTRNSSLSLSRLLFFHRHINMDAAGRFQALNCAH